MLKDSSVIYNGKSYGPVWICPKFPACQCFVGCHKGTEKPLGTLANPLIRYWRKKAHATFDPIWKLKKLKRKHCYSRLARALGVDIIHIGESDVETCKRIIAWAQDPANSEPLKNS